MSEQAINLPLPECDDGRAVSSQEPAIECSFGLEQHLAILMHHETAPKVELKPGMNDRVAVVCDIGESRYHFWLNRITRKPIDLTVYKNPRRGGGDASQSKYLRRDEGEGRVIADMMIRRAREQLPEFLALMMHEENGQSTSAPVTHDSVREATGFLHSALSSLREVYLALPEGDAKNQLRLKLKEAEFALSLAESRLG